MNQLDEAGRLWLADRFLSIPNAESLGVHSSFGEVHFPFVRNGEIVTTKSRSFTDKKKQRFDERPVGFKMPFWNQRNHPTSDYLIITEGEPDCLAITQLGETNCVSLPNGAQSVEKTFKDNYDYLQQYDKIYICFDMDDAGNKAALKAMEMLSPAKYRRIILPCKDANEWIQQDHPQLDDLTILMRNAQRVESDNFLNLVDLENDFFQQIDIGLKTGWGCLDKILGGLRLGELTVITADTGAGKTTFCCNLMYNIARHKQGVWINSYEMHYHSIARKIAGMILRKPMKLEEFDQEARLSFTNWCMNHKIYLNRMTTKTDLKTLRRQVEQASLAYNIKYILLDHLDYIHSAGAKPTTLENIDDAMREIHTLAIEFNVAIILVVHPKQSQDATKEITMSDLKGSSAIKQYADNIIALTRMDRIDPKQKNRVKVRVWKNRLLGSEGEVFLQYMKQFDCYAEF